MTEFRTASEDMEPRIAVEFLGLSHFDTSALEHVVAGAEFEHRRLPGGESDINLLQCALPNSVINRGVYGPAMLVNGTFARNAITIGAMLRQQEPTRVNGVEVEMGSMQFYAEHAEMCYRAWPAGTWFAFVITRERFQQFCSEHMDVAMDLPASGITHFQPESRQEVARLHSDLRDLDRSLSVLGTSEHAVRLGESVEHDLLARLAGMLCQRSPLERRDDRTRVRRCREMLRDAIALVDSDPGETLDLHSISKATGLSPRTLQRSFQTTCGLCPQEWFRVERLNRVRNDLLSARNGESVTDVAMRWGFFHFGRFAQYYRELFGERPSSTLRCSQFRLSSLLKRKAAKQNV